METEKPRIIFRADGDSRIGLGHVFRMAGLAEMLKPFARVELFTISDLQRIPGDQLEVFDAIVHVEEPGGVPDAWIHLIRSSYTVVTDGYSFHENYQKKIALVCHRLVMLDDYHPYSFFADVVINIAVGKVEDAYHGQWYTHFLFGFEYALLRNPFRQAAQRNLTSNRNGIFVCLGGADPENIILDIVFQLRKRFPEKSIEAVLGSAYLHTVDFLNTYKLDDKVNIHQGLNATQMVNLMSSVEFGVCSSSTIAYEFLCCHEKLAIVQTAENQKHLYDYLVDARMAVRWEEVLQEQAFGINQNILEKRQAMLSFSYADYFQKLFEHREFHLELASAADVKLYFDWANEPATRAQSFNSNPIPWSDHVSWFEKNIVSEHHVFLKFCENGKPVGQLRFSIEDGHWLINYSLDVQVRGRGLSELILRMACRYATLSGRTNLLMGYVKPDNIPSLKAFRKCGFREEIRKQNGNDVICFQMDLSPNFRSI